MAAVTENGHESAVVFPNKTFRK